MKISIIGQGAIAGYLRTNIAGHGITEIARIVRPGQESIGDAATPAYSTVDALPVHPDLLIDCGGHAALRAHGPTALRRGIDVLTLSLGALADTVLHDILTSAASDGRSRLHLASGAIGGLDALRAARTGTMDSVVYTGRKPPSGWLGSPAEDLLDLATLEQAATHFSGTAREAALAYPKNANVAAAVALAGVGFDRTRVVLIADPAATSNIHEISASGSFGQMQFTLSGNSLPDNPRSSALAAMSVLSTLTERQKRVGF